MRMELEPTQVIETAAEPSHLRQFMGRTILAGALALGVGVEASCGSSGTEVMVTHGDAPSGITAEGSVQYELETAQHDAQVQGRDDQQAKVAKALKILEEYAHPPKSWELVAFLADSNGELTEIAGCESGLHWFRHGPRSSGGGGILNYVWRQYRQPGMPRDPGDAPVFMQKYMMWWIKENVNPKHSFLGQPTPKWGCAEQLGLH